MITRSSWFLALALALSPAVIAQSGSSPAGQRELVTDIQTMLAELGYRPGPADGIMGARTRQAISRYQANAGLEIDGKPSEALREQLRVSTGRTDRAQARATFQKESRTSEPQWEGETTAAAMLKQTPSNASGTIRGLPVGTRVDVLGSRGAWLEVRLKDGETRGWLEFDDVRRAGAATAQAQPEQKGGFFAALSRGVTRLIRGSSGAGSQGTVTIGVRGLSREELSAAAPDPAEVEKLDGYGASEGDAETFAARTRLKAQSVAYLPEPRKTRSGAGGGQPPATGAGSNR